MPSSAFAFGKNKIVYDRFHFSIYHATHFDVYFYDEEKESLQKVVNLAESAYDDLSRKFNFQISKKIPLIFYATHSAFEQSNVELAFIPEGVGAFAEPVRNRMVLPIDSPDEKLLQLITHELTHIFEYEILFQGRVDRQLRVSPPTWFMEGLASFMGNDEDTNDRMVLRDAVVNDQIPSISRGLNGYFAYRFGHAVFRYIQEKYGWDGLRDFVLEYRNTLGSAIEKPLKRALDVTPEEFDSRFRTWLRKQYLPALVSKGEPSEYGDPFTVNPDLQSAELSPVVSPSGDLLAALTTYKEDVDIALFNVPERKLLRNLSPGYPEKYEYVIGQFVTTGPVMGRDVSFSSSGDQIAFFVKKERGRNLVIANALSGRIEKSIRMTTEQQLNPSFSPDGSKIVFHAFQGNRADIFVYDLSSGQTTNLTNDSFFDAAPVFTPDGQSIVYASIVGGYAKLFRLSLADPSKRYQLSTGSWNDIDPTFSPDGKRLFYASDRQTGRNLQQVAEIIGKNDVPAKKDGATAPADLSNYSAYNIYSVDLATGETLQFTDVVGGCFTPTVFTGTGNKERMVFSSYYKGRWRLYSTLTDKPLRKAERAEIPSQPLLPGERSQFLPPVEVTIDPEKVAKYGGFRLFVDDVQVNAGVNSDQTFVSRSVIYLSDMLGNRRFIASLDSVSTFSNFDFLYFDMQHRTNWGIRLFDDRTYFVTLDQRTSQIKRDRNLYQETGVQGILSHPFDRYHRLEVSGGYMKRSINYPRAAFDASGRPVRIFAPRSDTFPVFTTSFSGDNAQFKSFGPISGKRYDLSATYEADIKHGGTLSNDYVVDVRQYLQMSSRSLLAARLFGGLSEGNAPNFYYFGGLNTLRGYDFRSFVGDRAFFGNFEVRFPLVDVIATPLFALQQVRGELFFDVGGAFFKGDKFHFNDGRQLQDGRGAVGWGLSFNVFGLELHWDFARRTDLRTVESKTRTSFWIGETF